MPDLSRYTHYYIAENRLCHAGAEFLLHMDFPRCFIRFKLAESFTDFDTFYESIADVQWMDGEPPDAATQRRILVDAWNFLALDEEQLEENDLNRRIDEGLEG